MEKNRNRENAFEDMFAPYSPEKKGELLEYLRSCDENSTDNLFLGPEYLQKIIDLGIILPGITIVRVSQNPMPDAVYFVNDQFLLESRGGGVYNMSAVSAKPGVYKPEEILKNKRWSISGLKLFHAEDVPSHYSRE
jgi:hypothetical protein